MNGTSTANLRATVLVTTKDRRVMLANALRSIVEQCAQPDILVVDDGSCDDTSEFVAAEFPQAKLLRNPEPLGIIAARNMAVQHVATPILFTLDDDAVFTTPDTVKRALAHFDHAEVGVVSIPHINFLESGQQHMNACAWAGEQDFPCAASYSGGTNAKRVDLFRALGGYRGSGRQGEEVTYALRLLEAGFVVRIGDVPPIHHFPLAVSRDASEVAALAVRNSIVFGWQHAPTTRLPSHFVGTALNHLQHARKTNQLNATWRGIASGAVAIAKEKRSPVSRAAYKLYRRMRTTGPLRFSEVAPTLKLASKSKKSEQKPGF